MNSENKLLLELSRKENILEKQSNLKCKKFCDFILIVKNKLIFWRRK